jgi:hypothetical protein
VELGQDQSDGAGDDEGGVAAGAAAKKLTS